eukprot:TRINITY_DN56791_c0_g1_i1.p1 TRINITY_DN56791_c0_g1~~TRINITY_DN56791_c0_g1_i1.p1  ORF type:complete len:161 (-),score=1.25 TRINITY_DN56791_c0_g1_i1:102-584(-)
MFVPKQCVSGGQTGADQGILFAAKQLGIPTGGYLPNGCRTDDGPRPDMLEAFNMIESEGGYARRDKQNVELCDMIVAFRVRKPLTGKGTESTVQYAISGSYKFIPFQQDKDILVLRGKKPAVIFWDTQTGNNVARYGAALRELLATHRPNVVMSSGPCEN